MATKPDFASLLEAELDAHLAAVVSVECPCARTLFSGCNACVHNKTACESDCGCQGSGRRWLLHIPCPCRNDDAVDACDNCIKFGGRFAPGNTCPTDCPCFGLGYVFGGSVWEAVMALGGTLRAWIDHDTKQFVAECRLGSPMNKPQIFKSDDMDRAIKVCLARAQESQDA